ncbi:MAG TPA: xanthine dehydrogenase family protein molybdopterin-binding subunit [Candidatus Binatia bacterium]|nr:xanthine dehydrogenase family protein molybdopterin-binding subunit [Candidatus Binatia bacterium]
MSDGATRAGDGPGERAPAGWVGRPLPLTEAARFVAGRGRYLDDEALGGQLHAAILRSPHAHARILSIDVARAATHPGVHAVITGADAAARSRPIRPLVPTRVAVRDFCLAVDTARFAGEPVAAVAAVDRATAEDALELIHVEYEPLPPVVDAEAARQPGAPLLYPELGSNVVWHDTLTYGDVDGAFARADGVLRERFEIQRYASTPLETFGAVAAYDAGIDRYAFWTNDQRPGLTIAILAESLGVPQSRIALKTPDIGGGFGNKRRPAYLIICALLARRAGRPVKWIEDRLENLTALMHAAGGAMDVELAYRADGTLLALRVRDVTDEGKNLVSPVQHNLIKLGTIANGYRIPAVQYAAWSVLTNKCPSGANRGIGKPFMCFAIERSMALLARRLGLDPAELRLRNYVRPEEMPYTTPTGARYDSGDYPATLRRALERFGYARRRAEQARARGEGRLYGIGIATSVEPAGTNLASYELLTGRRAASGSAEAAMVRVEPDGHVRAALGDPSSGQGYETVVAQIVADELGVTPAEVSVARGFDSAESPWLYLSGNYSNKFSITDVGALVGAAREVRAKLLRIAAHRLEVDAADLELREGAAVVRGAVDRRLALAEVARTAYADVLGLPPGESPGLESRFAWSNPLAEPLDRDRRVRSQLVFANAAHLSLVEVDPRTGAVRVVAYAVVHDCGREINPLIVEGMVHGATVHGIGAALLEEFRYDETGQLLTATFMDYLKPTAADVPDIDVDRLEHPSPFSPLGAKGVGEGGAIAAPACIANAVEDALASRDVTIRTLPITPEQVWRWLSASSARPGAAAGRGEPPGALLPA